MAVKPTISMLSSVISHMPLQYVWRDSGVTQKHGFELIVDVCNMEIPGRPWIDRKERARLVLDGKYDFLSGLHHETYIYRAKGDKRFIYVAQAQNDWDDRIVTMPDVKTPKDLEGKKFIATTWAPCVFGNMKHALQLGGADTSKIDFVKVPGIENTDRCDLAVEAVVRGEAAATMVDIPFDLRGEKMGLRRLEVPSVPVIHNATICANRDRVVEDVESTLAFLRSMIDAIHYFKTNRGKSCEIIDRTLTGILGLQGDDEVEHLWEVWAGLLSPKPYPHPLAVWNVYNLDVAHDPNVNFIGPFEIWDTSYLRTIDDTDYIEELYGGAREIANPAVHVAI